MEARVLLTAVAIGLFSVIPLVTADGCKDVRLVSRAEWGAQSPRNTPARLRLPVGMTVVHHSDGATCTTPAACTQQLKIIQHFHMRPVSAGGRGWNDIGYSFLIGEDGRVYEGVGWNTVGAHTRNYNSRALGFCMLGKFGSRLPNQLALKALQNMIQCGVERGSITSTYQLFGHRDGGSTTCPGQTLYNLIQTWQHYRRPTRP